MPCEEAAREWLSASQGDWAQQRSALQALRFGTAGLQNCEEKILLFKPVVFCYGTPCELIQSDSEEICKNMKRYHSALIFLFQKYFYWKYDFSV